MSTKLSRTRPLLYDQDFPEEPMPILELNAVHRYYGFSKHALRGVDLSVEAGEVVGLVGRNGAGKTTLLRIASAVLRAQPGEVHIFGLDPWGKNAVTVKRRLGVVADTQEVPGNLRIRDLISLHKELYPSWDPVLETQLLQRLELRPDSVLNALSKGQARKVLLLCAVAHRPELLILDEPAGGLDPAARREFLEVSLELLRDSGSTILFSSHHTSDVERIATRVAILVNGVKDFDLPLEQLHHELCLVLLPHIAEDSLRLLEALPGWLKTTRRPTELCLVYRRDADQLRAELNQNADWNQAKCEHTSLEELFVALLGSGAQ